METKLLILTTFFAGLIAGLFYAWSISVTPGLANINDKSYLLAFQSMNRAILNPVFYISFMGPAILLPVTSYLFYTSSADIQFWLVLGATVLYLAGIMAVTMAGNVPLNNQLEVLQIEYMTSDEMSSFRTGFESLWNRLNWIRTISSGLTLLLLILALNQS